MVLQKTRARSAPAQPAEREIRKLAGSDTVFLILSASLAGPADRFACKSFAADVGRGRESLIVTLSRTLPLLPVLLLSVLTNSKPLKLLAS